MSRRRAPSALRRPISRVRSLTTISMMFMMTMPPTTSDSATTPIEHGEDAVGRRVIDAEQRVRREHAEVVRLVRAQPALDAQRHRRVVHGRLHHFGRLRLDDQLQAEHPRAEHLLEVAERDDREVVLRIAERGPLLLVTPTTRKCMRADRDRLVDRIDRPEQLVGDVPADDGHRPARGDFDRADQPPALDVVGGEVDVVGATPPGPARRRPIRCGTTSCADALASRGDRADVLAVLADGRRLLERDPRVVADAVLVGLRADRPASAGW